MPAVTGTTSHARLASAATSLTFAHTATGDVLVVSVFISDTSQSLYWVTYGGVVLQRIGRVTGGGFSHEWWVLFTPPAGTANVVILLDDNAAQFMSAGARNVSGVDLDGGYRNLTSASGSSTTPSVTVASAAGDLVLDMVGNETNNQVFTPGAGQTAQWAQNSLTTSDSYTAGSAEAGAASVTMSWTLSISGTWLISGLSLPAAGTISPIEARVSQDVVEALSQPTPPVQVSQHVVEVLSATTPIPGRLTQYLVEVLSKSTQPDLREHRVTQVVREVAIGEDEASPVEPPPSDPCAGGGEVPEGVNPSAGTSLATATVPLAWLEVTMDGATYRWAKAAIPHGAPKTGRVLTFGHVVRRLTDDHGGPQAATVTTTLADTDRVLRTAAFTGALQHALVEYFVADLATVQSGGAPQRVFRGRVHDWSADAKLTLTLTVEDELTARLTSADAVDVKSPQRIIGRATADATPPRRAYQHPAPEAYGTVGDVQDADEGIEQAGAWEPRHTANITIEDSEELGNMPMFVVSAQPIATVQRVFAADLTQDPPVDRVLVPDEAYGDWLFVPGKPGWPLDNPWYENQEGRWTVIFGNQNHPAIELAVQNRIPLVVDLCGYEDVGDTTGSVIDSPARGLLHWFLNRLFEDVRDDWVTTVFGLGDYSVLDTDTFEHVHDLCEARGYRLGGILGHDFRAVSWRERVAEWCANFGFDLGTNRHGQLLLTMLDTDSAFASSPLFTPATILEAGCAVRMRSDAVENIVPFVFGREYTTQLQRLNPASGERALREPIDRDWRSPVHHQVDESSITALGGTPRGERRAARQEYSLIRDGETAAAVSLARLRLHAPPNGRAEVTFRLLLRDGWDLELGDIVRVEHWDVPWTGPRRCQVRSLSVDLDAMVITVVVREVDDLLA